MSYLSPCEVFIELHNSVSQLNSDNVFSNSQVYISRRPSLHEYLVASPTKYLDSSSLGRFWLAVNLRRIALTKDGAWMPERIVQEPGRPLLGQPVGLLDA